MTATKSQMKLERIGLGWVGTFPGETTIKITRLRESSRGFVGEIEVEQKGRVLEWGEFNMLAPQTRASVGKRLAERVPASWGELLDEFCREVIRQERIGPPIEQTDDKVHGRELRYLLRPFLPYGMPTLVYGEGGSGKSTLAAAVALSIASGRSVFPGWSVDLTTPALILDWEANREVWEDRLNAIAAGARMNSHKLMYRACRRRLVDDAEGIAESIAAANVGFVIVDSVNLAFGYSGEHQDPADAANRAFNVIRQVSGTDITWLLLDHVPGSAMYDRKNGHTPMKAYGSVAKQWLARQQFYLAGEREATRTRQELVLKHTKANYSWLEKPLGMVIHREPGSIEFTFNEAIEDAELSNQLTIPQRIASALRDGALSVPDLRKKLDMDAKKADKDKVWVNLSRMVKRGEVVKVTGEKYKLDAGDEQEELAPPVDEDAL